ncbi:hypothetical protein Tco_1369394 [Tanacetum coccineum]
MFRVDRTKVKGIMLGDQLQPGTEEFRTEWAMQILVNQGILSVITAMEEGTSQENALNQSDHRIQNTSKTRCGQTNTFDNDVDEEPVQVLALNEDNILQANQCDAFDYDVDEAPTAQTMFMANLSSADPIYDEAGPSYDSDILSEVHDHDNYVDSISEYHEVHEMQNDVQPNYVVDFDAEYMSDSNIIPYEQYVKGNTVPVVQSNVSSVPNDALMMIINDMHEQTTQCVSANE